MSAVAVKTCLYRPQCRTPVGPASASELEIVLLTLWASSRTKELDEYEASDEPPDTGEVRDASLRGGRDAAHAAMDSENDTLTAWTKEPDVLLPPVR